MKALPIYSTIPEAVEWLSEQTKSEWSENKLLDFAASSQTTLHAGAPISQSAGLYEIDFEGLRTKSNPKGIKQISSTGWGMAELFPVHIAQILHVGETETIHAAGNPDKKKGELSLFSEPIKVTRDQLRISSNALHELLRKFRLSPRYNRTAVSTAPSETTGKPPRGIPKQQVMDAFEGLHFTRDRWNKNLASPPDWLSDCCVQRGNKTTSALWNPALIAVGLRDKGISLKKLDAVFVGLRNWAEEWGEVSEIFRELHTG